MNEKEKIEKIVLEKFKIDTDEFKALDSEERERKELIAKNTIKLFINHNELFKELAK
ncbi:MAG: hypothetical protein SOY60_05965 [Fusobacterium gastrosuis]|uniref:hypothetical protein n=1 Tax=Fusobacterium TaxID=848 RepID=UPI0025C6D94D|nr:hypothetical protein [Fusobacterium sp.]MCI5725793.1 hypothetical protein [Fusobacterium sp.]MDY4011192.1 hypothetical protein [Fusobacterium gastrosuis]